MTGLQRTAIELLYVSTPRKVQIRLVHMTVLVADSYHSAFEYQKLGSWCTGDACVTVAAVEVVHATAGVLFWVCITVFLNITCATIQTRVRTARVVVCHAPVTATAASSDTLLSRSARITLASVHVRSTNTLN